MAVKKRTNQKKAAAARGSKSGSQVLADLCDVTRDVPVPVQLMLWGRAAGRCEFSGCNKSLLESSVTQEQVNIAQKAHIYSFSSDGPRGNKGITKEKLNDISNLTLVCHECHRKIDQRKDGGRYTVDLLRAWKAEHERRIEIVTGINPTKKSHVLLYGANIGSHTSPVISPTRPHPSSQSDTPPTTSRSSSGWRIAPSWTGTPPSGRSS